MRYVLDTTFLIDHMRNARAAVLKLADMFERGDQMLVNEISVCELAAGVSATLIPQMTALLEPIEFVQPGPESALLAGQWRREARAIGSTLSLPDALIAAAAYHLDAAVLTRNFKDFALTPARVETY
jgi:predicted nucleic acid-binding protein